jgi:hypothetical protein
MKARIRGGDAARAAVATTERLPVTLQATDLLGPFQSVPEAAQRKKPPQVRKPLTRHDVIYAPTGDLETHRAILRNTFGTLSEEFAWVSAPGERSAALPALTIIINPLWWWLVGLRLIARSLAARLNACLAGGEHANAARCTHISATPADSQTSGVPLHRRAAIAKTPRRRRQNAGGGRRL